MKALNDIRAWIESLSISEKRNIKLQGLSRAGKKGSQQLELFDWLQSEGKKINTPPPQRLEKGLPTYIKRLKQLILDSLQVLKKNESVNLRLSSAISEIEILIEKGLIKDAQRKIKRYKQIAETFCRYAQVLVLLESERQLIRPMEMQTKQYEAHLASSAEIRGKSAQLNQLQLLHSWMLARVRQLFVPRTTEDLAEIQEKSQQEFVLFQLNHGAFLENALAANILGLANLAARQPIEAIKRYAVVLANWKNHPEWQADQPQLLLSICKNYQAACTFGARNWESYQSNLALLPDFKALPEKLSFDFNRILYHNQFTMALNMVQFETVEKLIKEIAEWIEANRTHFTEVQILPFWHNFAVAAFLCDDLKTANRFVINILHLPNRNARKDIREFALVLQAIIQFELENLDLNEYLTRAGKRHFKQKKRDIDFELVVMQFLENANKQEQRSDLSVQLNELIEKLDELAEQAGNWLPMLGLMEVRLWAQAKRDGLPLRTVFQMAIQKIMKEEESKK